MSGLGGIGTVFGTSPTRSFIQRSEHPAASRNGADSLSEHPAASRNTPLKFARGELGHDLVHAPPTTDETGAPECQAKSPIRPLGHHFELPKGLKGVGGDRQRCRLAGTRRPILAGDFPVGAGPGLFRSGRCIGRGRRRSENRRCGVRRPRSRPRGGLRREACSSAARRSPAELA